MTPMLKAPNTKRFKLRHDGPLSNDALKFNSRRYTKETYGGDAEMAEYAAEYRKVGRCTSTLSNPS